MHLTHVSPKYHTTIQFHFIKICSWQLHQNYKLNESINLSNFSWFFVIFTFIQRQFGLNQIPQQCGPQQVCCRKPIRQQPQPGQCGRRNTQGITGRIKNPVFVDGDSEFGGRILSL